MTEYLAAIIITAGLCWVVIAIATRYIDLLDHREQRAHEARSLRTHDVAALAAECVDLRQTLDGAFRKHEERITELELTTAGPVRRAR